MSNLLTINNVRGYIDDNGIAQLNLEDCARGLGFTTVATSGNECVRWARVEEYLGSFGFSQQVGKETFIPENIFYRLAMKAKNETAEKFQTIVCDEILPQIRKTGTYAPQQLTKMQILELAMESEKKVIELEATITEQKPKVVFAESVECSKTSILVKGLSVILSQNGIDIGQNRLFDYLRDNGYLCKQQGRNYNKPTQRSMDMKIMQEKTTTINKPDREPIITNTPLITGKGQVYFVNKFLNEVTA